MRFAALLQAAGLILCLILIGGGMNSSCSLMSEANDAAVALGVTGTLAGWVGLAILGRLAYRLGRREFERLKPEDETKGPRPVDDE